MLWNLFTTTAFILAGLLFYRFWPRIFTALKRFDAENRERIEGERRDRIDSLAHFRHTLKLASEEVEEIGEIEVPDLRTGQGVKRYLFEGERFVSMHEAARARDDKIRAKARAFYVELPAALSRRNQDGKLGKD